MSLGTRDDVLCSLLPAGSELNRESLRQLLLVYHPDKAARMTEQQRLRLGGRELATVTRVITDSLHAYDAVPAPCVGDTIHYAGEGKRKSREAATNRKAKKEVRFKTSVQEREANQKEYDALTLKAWTLRSRRNTMTIQAWSAEQQHLYTEIDASSLAAYQADFIRNLFL